MMIMGRNWGSMGGALLLYGINKNVFLYMLPKVVEPSLASAADTIFR